MNEVKSNKLPAQLATSSSKDRLIPYKILVLLEHSTLPFLRRPEGLTHLVVMRTGPMSRYLRYRVPQIHDALAFLKLHNLIRGVDKLEKGVYAVELRTMCTCLCDGCCQTHTSCEVRNG